MSDTVFSFDKYQARLAQRALKTAADPSPVPEKGASLIKFAKRSSPIGPIHGAEFMHTQFELCQKSMLMVAASALLLTKAGSHVMTSILENWVDSLNPR